MLYKKPTLQSKQGQQRICCDMWFLCNLLKNLYKTCFQNHLIKKILKYMKINLMTGKFEKQSFLIWDVLEEKET